MFTLDLNEMAMWVRIEDVRTPGWWVSQCGEVTVHVEERFAPRLVRRWYSGSRGHDISDTASGDDGYGNHALFRRLKSGESITFTQES